MRSLSLSGRQLNKVWPAVTWKEKLYEINLGIPKEASKQSVRDAAWFLPAVYSKT